MSLDLPSCETSAPQRVPAVRWYRFVPYLVLFSVVSIVVALSKPAPLPVVETPLPRPAALDESEAQSVRGGFWAVQEMWLGPKLEFTEKEESERMWGEMRRLDRGETPVLLRYTERMVRVSSKQTLELTSRTEVSQNRVMQGHQHEREQTEMVYITRFDPEGLGTVNALPIAWNEEKEAILSRIDAGESLKGLYAFNGNTMQLYLPGDVSTPRPATIPQTLNPTDRLFCLRRSKAPKPRSNDEGIRENPEIAKERYVSSIGIERIYPSDWPPKFDGTIHQINADGVVDFTSFDGHRGYMRVEELPQPITTPIERVVYPPRSKKIFRFCHTNGWILQTEYPEHPTPIPPLPHQKVHPAIQWIRDQAQKLK